MTAQLHKPARCSARRERGFTILEIIIVVAISSIMAAIAIPGYLSMMRYLRIAGDSRDINASVALAKMRAAQDYSHARVHANLGTNTFSVEVWNKTGNGGAGCWTTEGDAPVGGVVPCTSVNSPTNSLSQGVSFGTNGALGGGLNPQAVAAQAPICRQGVAGGPLGAAYEGTACIEFNSRGVPVAWDNKPPLTVQDALYVTDQNSVYGVTVIQTGLIQVWCMYANTTTWNAR